VFRPIRTLSGGEKNKLSLARLTHLNPNLLVLDEPTNHLDMDSREALAGVLNEFKGTLILVSHDRWLLGQVTDHTLDIKRSGAKEYPGSYEEYRSRGSRPPPQRPAPQAGKPQETKEEEARLSPRELSKEIQRLEKLVETLEQQVADQEQEMKDLEEQLANLPPTADVFALTTEHQRLKESIEGSLSAWEEQASRLEEMRTLQGRG